MPPFPATLSRRRRRVAGATLLLFLGGLAWGLRTYPGDQLIPLLGFVARARPLEEVARDPTTPPFVAERLEAVRRARAAARSLGLEVGGAYTTVSDDGGGPLVWVVTAAPPDRLEPVAWRYPLVGALAYRGFFSGEQAQAFAAHLERQGLDVHLRGAAAFSVLGWLEEPLPSSCLLWPEEDLVALILHECLHRTVFFPGQTRFNESLATFVERRGAEEVLRGAPLARLRERWQRADRVQGCLEETAEELEALYARCRSPEEARRLRAPVFRRLEERLGGLDLSLAGPWNNARLLGSLAYTGDLKRIEAVYRSLGGDLRALIRCFASMDRRQDPWGQLRDSARRASPRRLSGRGRPRP